jgi:hypothetical protein
MLDYEKDDPALPRDPASVSLISEEVLATVYGHGEIVFLTELNFLENFFVQMESDNLQKPLDFYKVFSHSEQISRVY